MTLGCAATVVEPAMTRQTGINAATDEPNNQFLHNAARVLTSDCATSTIRTHVLSVAPRPSHMDALYTRSSTTAGSPTRCTGAD
jgi:hypothetical protein